MRGGRTVGGGLQGPRVLGSSIRPLGITYSLRLPVERQQRITIPRQTRFRPGTRHHWPGAVVVDSPPQNLGRGRRVSMLVADPRRPTDPPQTPPANQAFCSQHAAGERSAAPPSPPFCTSAPTAVRQCPLGSVLAGEQPYRSRSAAVSRSERSAQAPRPPLPALATDLTACSISRPSARKLSMISMVERNIKSWTTAARISRSERRSSQKPRAAKDRC